MSLLDARRQDVLASKNHELATVAASHASHLQTIRAVTAILANNTGLSTLVHAQYNHSTTDDAPVNGSTDDDESAWLKANSLLNGRTFDEATLPFPSIPHHDAPIYTSEPNRPSEQPYAPAKSSASANGLGTKASVSEPAHLDLTVDPLEKAVPLLGTSGLTEMSDGPLTGEIRRNADAQHEGDAVAMGEVAPAEPDEEATLSPIATAALDLQSPHRPAKTVHLPPEDVQEERLHERQEAEAERRKSDSERAPRPSQLQPPNDLASSPSSTVGAYSAATPMPPQESPDTSPDSGGVQMDMLRPKDLRPSPEEQHAKEEHDRLLEAQKEVARRQALGTETTPDDQLQWEARAAAAREAEERAARESVTGPEPDAKRVVDETEAEQVTEEIEADAPRQDAETAVDNSAQKTGQAQEIDATEEDGDNITVTPRVALPHPVDTSMQKSRHTKTTSEASEAALPTKAALGSGARKSIAEAVSETPPRSNAHRRSSVLSQEAVSPSHVRRGSTSVAMLQTPRRSNREVNMQSSPLNVDPHFEDLAVLKGAADDPDRDYLEPLFRIQAHDSPNSRTKPLQELVKVANKYLSTDDQFAALHERMDYRTLRRIYQLQNANKWSLRQMEHCKEPEPPVTHWDHMMSEMKWMRKDFRAERKMKKNVSAWLAARCADWVAAEPEERVLMQVKVKQPQIEQHGTESEEPLPELETSGESAPEDELPPTPTMTSTVPSNLIVAPELSDVVINLQKAGRLGKALRDLPVTGFSSLANKASSPPMTAVSRFVEGKVLPKASGTIRKRSRFEYDDDAAALDAEPESKRLRESRSLMPEDEDVALFHPDNKHIRDRLHANNAFRPPSEFVMPSTSFYEWRNCSQWIWEDDTKLRKLAKEYSFNWSLIADEMTLPSRNKSSAERRTPWECFERWVELESLPADMRKTMYFKTWFQRLEQSAHAAERRYQAQVAAIQAQATNGQQPQVPARKRTTPTRVEKRKNSRYLWLVEAMRKLARKRETTAYKQAEAQRAAAQRKSQTDTSIQKTPAPMMTPQEFSKRRYERDLQIAEVTRQHRQKMMEAQQRQLQMARAAQQGTTNGAPVQQRPNTSGGVQQQMPVQANGQPSANMNGQLPQQSRPALPMATRNGHLAVPQVNAQGIPQAPMRPTGAMTQPDMQRLAQANAQRGVPYGAQQGPMPNGALPSPGSSMTTAQQLQHNQQLLAQMTAQQQSNNAAYNNHAHTSNPSSHQQGSAPGMPPPPTPQSLPQQLSSGHVPALIAIKSQLRTKHPHLSEEQLTTAATETLTQQSRTQSSNQVRQNALNAAAGLPGQAHGASVPNYAHNQAAYHSNQGNHQVQNGNPNYMNGVADNNASQQAGLNNAPTNSPQAAAAYANQMRQRQMAMLRMQQSPNATHAQPHNPNSNSSPGVTHASPNMTPVSPAMQYSNMAAPSSIGGAGGGGGRPASRSNTPQMQRLGSASSVPGVVGTGGNGMQSPGGSNMAQGSPAHNMQAGMAR